MAEERKRCPRCETYQILALTECFICGYNLALSFEPEIKPAEQKVISQQPTEKLTRSELEEMIQDINDSKLEEQEEKRKKKYVIIGLVVAVIVLNLIIRILEDS